MGKSGQSGSALTATLKVLAGLAFLAIVLAGAAWFEAERRLTAEGPLGKDTILWIERGDSVAAVQAKLVEMDALEPGLSEHLFTLESRIEDLAADLRAGEFVIPAQAGISEIVTLLKEGKPLLRFVTVPEGRTSRQVLAIVNEAPLMDGTLETLPPEGSLLPETYSYQRGDSRQTIIDRMTAAHDRVLEELWAGRAPGLPIDSPEEAVILASIVEKETGLASERPLVASVFVNRLRRGMRLQSDPTIIYGLTGGEPLGRGILQSELDRETPYNTYQISGLPPTPIANPGEAAMAAVLNPPDTDYFYFVADGTGGHAFASSLTEHNRNVREWRRIERQRAVAE